MAVRVARHHAADAHAARGLGHRAEQRPALEHVDLGIAQDRREVVEVPEVVEAGLVGQLPDGPRNSAGSVFCCESLSPMRTGCMRASLALVAAGRRRRRCTRSNEVLTGPETGADRHKMEQASYAPEGEPQARQAVPMIVSGEYVDLERFLSVLGGGAHRAVLGRVQARWKLSRALHRTRHPPAAGRRPPGGNRRRRVLGDEGAAGGSRALRRGHGAAAQRPVLSDGVPHRGARRAGAVVPRVLARHDPAGRQRARRRHRDRRHRPARARRRRKRARGRA